MNLRTKLLAAGFASLLMLSGCNDDTSTSVTPPPVAEEPAVPETPAVATTVITTTDGETINVKVTENGFVFEGYEGKIVLLEVYGYTCPHCISAIPVYNAIQNNYKNDVVVISIEDYGQSAAGLANGLAKQMQYRTVAQENSGNMKHYIEGFVGPLGGVPYLLVLGRDGALDDVIPPMDVTYDLVASKITPLL